MVRRKAKRAVGMRKRAGMLPGEAKRQSLVTVERVSKAGEAGLTTPDHYVVTSHYFDGVWTYGVELAGQRMALPGKVVDQINRHRKSILTEQRRLRAVERAERILDEDKQPSSLP
jgi:hypothetical protein